MKKEELIERIIQELPHPQRRHEDWINCNHPGKPDSDSMSFGVNIKTGAWNYLAGGESGNVWTLGKMMGIYEYDNTPAYKEKTPSKKHEPKQKTQWTRSTIKDLEKHYGLTIKDFEWLGCKVVSKFFDNVQDSIYYPYQTKSGIQLGKHKGIWRDEKGKRKKIAIVPTGIKEPRIFGPSVKAIKGKDIFLVGGEEKAIALNKHGYLGFSFISGEKNVDEATCSWIAGFSPNSATVILDAGDDPNPLCQMLLLSGIPLVKYVDWENEFDPGTDVNDALKGFPMEFKQSFLRDAPILKPLDIDENKAKESAKKKLLDICVDIQNLSLGEINEKLAFVQNLISIDTWPEIQSQLTLDDLPDFPYDIFPSNFHEWIDQASLGFSVPKMYVAMLFLLFTGVSIRGRWLISPKNKWNENSCVWGLTAMRTGQGKSSIMEHFKSFFYDPMNEMNQNIIVEREPEIIVIDQLNKAYKDLKKRGENGEDVGDSIKEIRQKITDASKRARKTYDFFFDKSTPEAFEKAMDEFQPFTNFISSEGGPLDNLSGSGSYKPDYSSYLLSYDGSTLKIDKIRGDTKHIVYNPCVNMILATQNEEFSQKYSKIKGGGDKGFWPRFNYCFPRQLSLESKVYHDIQIPSQLEFEVRRFFQKVFTTETPSDPELSKGSRKISRLKMDPEASQMVIDYHRESDKLHYKEGDPDRDITDWMQKSRGMVVRFSAIFHVMEYPNDFNHFKISSRSVSKAIRYITEFQKHHARYAYEQLGISYKNTDEAMNMILSRITEKRANEITYQEIRSLVSSKYRENIRDHLTKLVISGYLKEDYYDARGRLFKDPVRYKVNPQLTRSKS